MIRRIYFSLFFIFIISTGLSAQEITDSSLQVELFPAGLNVPGIKANYQEARIGVLYFPSNRNLKVDVGNSVDLISLNNIYNQARITLGIEFFAYALSTSFAGNRLQIDALDGLFGGNMSYSKKIKDDIFFTRLRILHNSAHLVDGHYDRETDKWINDKKPIPYTKDFGELTLGFQKNSDLHFARIYGGLSYATLVRPYFLKRWNFSGGFETCFQNMFSTFHNKPANVFIGYHFLLNGARKYTGNSSFIAGLKFGEWMKKGLLFYAEYYVGNRRFSEYYDERVKEFGLGFSVDFF